MDETDRQNALEILGYGSAPTVLDDPYPLGGYSGVSIALSQRLISTTDLRQKGTAMIQQGDTSYFELTLGKGLYHNLDMLIHFVPGQQQEDISGFGGTIRWGFFEAEYLPITLSAQVGANSTSFQDKIKITSQSMDLIASFAVQDVTLYFGGGSLRASGSFIGGDGGITDTKDVESETVSTSRMLAGLSVKFSPFFVALEMNRSTQTSYGLKLGTRF